MKYKTVQKKWQHMWIYRGEMVWEDVKKVETFSWASQALWVKETYLWIQCAHQIYFTLIISCYLKLPLPFNNFCLFERERQGEREHKLGKGRGKVEAQTRWTGCPKRRGIPGPWTLAWAEGVSSSTYDKGLAVASCMLITQSLPSSLPLNPYKHWSHKDLSTNTNAPIVILCPPRCC